MLSSDTSLSSGDMCSGGYTVTIGELYNVTNVYPQATFGVTYQGIGDRKSSASPASFNFLSPSQTETCNGKFIHQFVQSLYFTLLYNGLHVTSQNEPNTMKAMIYYILKLYSNLEGNSIIINVHEEPLLCPF